MQVSCSLREQSEKKNIEIKNKEVIRDPCFQCELATTRAVKLKRHVQHKHARVIFPCSQCEYAQRSEVSLFS